MSNSPEANNNAFIDKAEFDTLKQFTDSSIFSEQNESEERQSEKVTFRKKIDYTMISTRRARKALGIRLQPYVRDVPKIGRNTMCICGSGIKFKKCCGRNVE